MLQKYFPILSEVNSPLAAMAALELTADAAKIVINGISNEVLETLLKDAVSSTEAHCKEVEISTSGIEAARKAAAKTTRTLRYRAAMAARNARVVSKTARRIKASKRLQITTLRGLSGLSLDACRINAAVAQTAVRSAVNTYNTATQAVESAIQGGDIRAIHSAVAALKEAVRTLEVRHLEFKFAREMLAIALARHSA